MFKSIFAPILAVMALITVVGLLYQGKLPFTKLQNVNNSITNNKNVITIEDKEIKVEVAKSNEERAKGLSNRTSLDENSGMVFVFEKDTKTSFWMKDTKIALDIIWINDDKVVGIDKDVKPEVGTPDSKLKRYNSPGPIDYVVEVNAGFSDKNGFKVGSIVQKLSDL